MAHIRFFWTVLVIFLTPQLAKGEQISLGGIAELEGYNTAFQSRGALFFNLAPLLPNDYRPQNMAQQWGIPIFETSPPSFGRPMVAVAPAGIRWKRVSLTVSAGARVYAYRGRMPGPGGAFSPLRFLDEPSPLGSDPRESLARNLIPGLTNLGSGVAVKSWQVGNPAERYSLKRVEFNDLGPIDFITVGENVRFGGPLMGDFSFTPFPPQVIFVDFDTPIRQKFVPQMDLWNTIRGFAYTEKVAPAKGFHPVARSSSSWNDQVFQAFTNLLGINDLKIEVVRQPPVDFDNVLIVRFGQAVLTQTGGQTAIGLLGLAYDITYKSRGGEIDRFNLRPDGEVAILLDEESARDDPNLNQFNYGPSFVASVMLHEVGHAFGLYHIEPDPFDLSQVMDYQWDGNVSETLFQYPTQRCALPTEFCYPDLEHNNLYHWRRYAENAGKNDLANLIPGGWDRPVGDGLGALNQQSQTEPTFEITTIEVDVRNSGGVSAFDVYLDYVEEPGERTGILVDSGAGPFIGNLQDAPFSVSRAHFGVNLDRPYYLVGKSAATAPYDLIFAFGSLTQISDWREGLSQGLPGKVFRYDHNTGETTIFGSFKGKALTSQIVLPEPADRTNVVKIVDTGLEPVTGSLASILFNTISQDGDAQFFAGRITIESQTIIDSVDIWMVPPSGRIKLKLYSDYEGLPFVELFNKRFISQEGSLPRWEPFESLDWGVNPGNYWIAIEPQDGSGYGQLPTDPQIPLSAYSFFSPLNNKWLSMSNAAFGIRISGESHAAQAPSITIERMGDHLRVSWPATNSAFILQRTGSLDGAATLWELEGAGQTVSEGRIVVTVPLADGIKFYRLKR